MSIADVAVINEEVAVDTSPSLSRGGLVFTSRLSSRCQP